MKILSSLFCLFIVSCSSSKVLENQVNYQIDEKLLEEIQGQMRKNRTPASLTEELTPSTKRVYFKTLYEQYLTYTKISHAPRNIKYCPAFHLDFLEAQETIGVLPSNKDEARVARIEKELGELCDKGVSANYYRFENLVSYHTSKKAFHQNPMSIFSLLKIPVFQNMYELKTTHGVAANHPRLVELTGTYWFTSYLEKIKVSETSLVRR